MKPCLVIVQNRPTQFDEPLYAFMHRSGEIDLKVIYTETSDTQNGMFDREIGRSPDWDHIETHAYNSRNLSQNETQNPGAVAADIAAVNPNLVLLCGYYPPLHARLAWLLGKRGLRIGLRSDNTLEHSDFGGLKGLVKRLILPRWLRRYDTWHPVGSLARRYLETISGAQKPTFLFPYSVDVDWFARQAVEVRKQRSEFRRQLGLADEDFVILGVLKWHAREDPLTLLRAFDQLNRRQPQARLILVGDGPLRDEVQQLIDGMKNNSVVLPGYQPYSALPRFYALSDVFVHPAPDEPWGVSVQEAMACSLPVVVADGVGAKVEMVDEGQTGFVFPNGNHEVLAAILEKLQLGSGQHKKMGDAALKKARQFDYQFSLGQMLAALAACD